MGPYKRSAGAQGAAGGSGHPAPSIPLYARIIIFILVVLVAVPLLRVALGDDFAYSLNVAYYTQKIFLISSLFVFISFLILKDDIPASKSMMPDWDDAIAFSIIALVLFGVLAAMQVNFDSLMQMGAATVHDGTMEIGFGSFLSDSIELDRIGVMSPGITKVVTLDNDTADPVALRIHAGWSGDAFSSNVSLSVNGAQSIDITGKYAALKDSIADWISVQIPSSALHKGKNSITLSSTGDSWVFVSSQWVYHDAKTLNPDGSYYGEEALIYLDKKPDLSVLFRHIYGFESVFALVAMIVLVLALFRREFLIDIGKRHGLTILAVAAISVIAINSVYVVQDQWVALSTLTAKLLHGIIGAVWKPYSDLQNLQGPILGLNGFYMAIYKSCSGIESLSVFTLLFLVTASYNWRKMNKAALPFLFLLGIIGTFFLNVTRLGVLLLVGAFVSSDLAVNVFHTNLGWLLVLAYFAVFNEVLVRFFAKGDPHAA